MYIVISVTTIVLHSMIIVLHLFILDGGKEKDVDTSTKENTGKKDTGGFDAFDGDFPAKNGTGGTGSGFEFNSSADVWGAATSTSTSAVVSNGDHANKIDFPTKSSIGK